MGYEDYPCIRDTALNGLTKESHSGKENGLDYYTYKLNSEGMKIVTDIINHNDNIIQNKSQEFVQVGIFFLTGGLVITAGMELVLKYSEFDKNGLLSIYGLLMISWSLLTFFYKRI